MMRSATAVALSAGLVAASCSGSPESDPGATAAGILAGALVIGAATAVSGDDDISISVPQAASAVAIAVVIARKLQEVTDACRALAQPEYQVDCLGEGYARATREIPANATFGDARDAVNRAAARLSALAAANKAEAAPQAGAAGRSRPLTAVDPARLAAVRERAAQIVEETETELLRSSATSTSRREPYQKIAAALNSGKVLLRSA